MSGGRIGMLLAEIYSDTWCGASIIVRNCVCNIGGKIKVFVGSIPGMEEKATHCHKLDAFMSFVSLV